MFSSNHKQLGSKSLESACSRVQYMHIADWKQECAGWQEWNGQTKLTHSCCTLDCTNGWMRMMHTGLTIPLGGGVSFQSQFHIFHVLQWCVLSNLYPSKVAHNFLLSHPICLLKKMLILKNDDIYCLHCTLLVQQ